MKKIEVAGAILLKEGKILCARRKESALAYISKKFEFPGGKLEPGESPKEALHRELLEEMDLFVSMEDMQEFYVAEHQYPDFFIKMHCFLCPMPKQNFLLREHLEAQWIGRNEIQQLDWVPADIPVVKALAEKGF